MLLCEEVTGKNQVLSTEQFYFFLVGVGGGR